MTKLSERKSRLILETDNAVCQRGKQRQIMTELRPGYMILRLKGSRRRSYVLSYTSAFNLAVHNELLRSRLEKARSKKRKA